MAGAALKIDVLPLAQRRLWPELTDVPEHFVLYGGTAIALQLGHRTSIDFDLFSFRPFDPDDLLNAVPFLDGSTTVQKGPNTLTCRVDRGEPVLVSFFAVPKLRQVADPLVAEGPGLLVASLVDLAGMKAAVVQKRAEVKDYVDLDALIRLGGIDLPTALAAARVIYGPQFAPEITLKALSYFGDGTVPQLARAARDRLVAAVRGVDLDRLPDLGPGRTSAP
jgi:hypothetical protein